MSQDGGSPWTKEARALWRAAPWRRKSIFPPPEEALEDGALCCSETLDCAMLLDAYYHGIFPWPFEEETILWASPPMRGILPLEEFHIRKSLLREWKKTPFSFRIDCCFLQVMQECAKAPRPDGPGTWITKKMIRAYHDFHRMGYAHSFEAFTQDGKLAGGLYGVVIGRVFCGESMFFKVSGASKHAFCFAAQELRKAGIVLVDTQMATPLLQSFGAREVPRGEYLALLEQLRGDQPTTLEGGAPPLKG